MDGFSALNYFLQDGVEKVEKIIFFDYNSFPFPGHFGPVYIEMWRSQTPHRLQ